MTSQLIGQPDEHDWLHRSIYSDGSKIMAKFCQVNNDYIDPCYSYGSKIIVNFCQVDKDYIDPFVTHMDKKILVDFCQADNYPVVLSHEQCP